VKCKIQKLEIHDDLADFERIDPGFCGDVVSFGPAGTSPALSRREFIIAFCCNPISCLWLETSTGRKLRRAVCRSRSFRWHHHGFFGPRFSDTAFLSKGTRGANGYQGVKKLNLMNLASNAQDLIFRIFVLLSVLLTVASLASFLLRPRARVTGAFPTVFLTGLIFILWTWTTYQFQKNSWESQNWNFGWVLPKGELGSVSIGISFDFATLMAGVFSSFIALLSHVYLWSRGMSASSSRMIGAVGMGLVGTVAAWASTSLWGSFVGLAFCLLSGVLALSAHWDQGTSAFTLHAFTVERVCALGLAILGASYSAGSLESASNTSLFLLVMGLLIFIQPFPLLSALTKEISGGTFGRVFLAQALPVWTVVAIFYRHSAIFASDELRMILGSVGSIGALLAALTGFLQSNWKSSFALWVSAAGMLMISILGIVGPVAAVSVAAAMLLAVLALSITGDSSDATSREGAAELTGQSPRAIQQVLIGLSVVCGMGGPLFVGASGYHAFLFHAISGAPMRATWVVVSLSAVSVLGFLSAARLMSSLPSKRVRNQKWSTWVSALTLLSGLGVFWMGTLTGYEPSVFSDALTGSVLIHAISTPLAQLPSPLMVAVQVLILSVTGFIAWWINQSKKSWTKVGGPKTRRVLTFVSAGYETDRVFETLLSGFQYLGTLVRTWIDERTFALFFPQALSRGVTTLGRFGYRIDTLLSRSWVRLFSALGDGMTAGLRQAHSGNLQWYITFAIGSGIALLIHFLLSQPK